MQNAFRHTPSTAIHHWKGQLTLGHDDESGGSNDRQLETTGTLAGCQVSRLRGPRLLFDRRPARVRSAHRLASRSLGPDCRRWMDGCDGRMDGNGWRVTDAHASDALEAGRPSLTGEFDNRSRRCQLRCPPHFGRFSHPPFPLPRTPHKPPVCCGGM